MSDPKMEQAQELAKILKDLDPDDWLTVKKIVDGLKGETKESEPGWTSSPTEKRLRPKVVLNPRAASIITGEGLVVSVDKDGDVTCAWDGKPLMADEDPRVWIPVKELKQCVRHVISLRNNDAKALEAKLGEVEEKIRYFAKNGKKAFACGLAIGRKG